MAVIHFLCISMILRPTSSGDKSSCCVAPGKFPQLLPPCRHAFAKLLSSPCVFFFSVACELGIF